MRVATVLLPTLLALALTARSPLALARTDAEKAAQVLFVDGMKLMGQKRYGEACPKLAQSQELDPGMGTQFRLAECYEKLGRMASAYDQFTAVADAARAAKKPDREGVARQRASAIEGKLAKLTITVPLAIAGLDGLKVSRDGAPVDRKLWGSPVPVDAGEHTVSVEAAGKKPWESKATATDGAQVSVAVPLLEDLAAARAAPPPARSVAPAIALGVAGGIGLVLGGAFVGLRATKISSAHTLHDKISAAHGDCLGGAKSKFAANCASLAGATSSGDTFGTASVIGFAVGGAAFVAMTTYLLLPPPRPTTDASLRWAPVIGAGQGGVVIWGGF
jgi:hypothetical protein